MESHGSLACSLNYQLLINHSALAIQSNSANTAASSVSIIPLLVAPPLGPAQVCHNVTRDSSEGKLATGIQATI